MKGVQKQGRGDRWKRFVCGVGDGSRQKQGVWPQARGHESSAKTAFVIAVVWFKPPVNIGWQLLDGVVIFAVSQPQGLFESEQAG
jgi:hypothetical protein